MNKKMEKWILFFVLVFLLFYLLLRYSVKEVTKQYEMSRRVIKNPGKGYYVQVSSEHWDRIEKYADTADLFFLEYDLYHYRSRPLDSDKLEELERFFRELRKNHSGCIFRAAYGFERYKENDAVSLDLVETHILQIAPILNDNQDLVFAVQAGFFGPWGEWHSSIYLEEGKEGEASRNKVWLVKKLLDELDESIAVNLRRPADLQEVCRLGCDRKRLGIHNDGLLASDTDLGTYRNAQDREETLQWLKENLVTGYNGGEMPYAGIYTEPDRVLEEFSKMKVSYLNQKYNEAVYEAWKKERIGNENAYQYISRHLGYAIYISEIKYPEEIKPDWRMLGRFLEIEITNGGFAPLSREYELHWVIRYSDSTETRIEAAVSLASLEQEEKLRLRLPLFPYCQKEIQRIGILISSRKSDAKIELANDGLLYSDGITYLWERELVYGGVPHPSSELRM